MYVYPEFTNSTVNQPKQFGMLLGATLCQMCIINVFSYSYSYSYTWLAMCMTLNNDYVR